MNYSTDETLTMTSRDLAKCATDSPRLDKAIRAGLLLAIVFTALAHGAVEAWAVAIFELIVVALVLTVAARFIVRKRVAIRVPAALLPLIALLALGLVQSIAVADGAGRWRSLSMDVEATRATTLVLFFLTASFLIAANFFTDRERLRSLVNFLIIFGLAMALFALVQHFTWNGRLYWLRPITADGANVFGPFVNRNHFAGYMEMLLPLAIALVITRAARRDSRLFYIFAATMMAVALIASLSRGGMISLIAQLIFIAAMCAKRRDEGDMARPVGTGSPALRAARMRGEKKKMNNPFLFILHPSSLILVAIAAGVVWVGPERIINRVTGANVKSEGAPANTFFASRGWIWRDTLLMIRANPIVGVGLGAYETAYPIYSQDDGAITLGKSFTVDRAHNDYLQALADCGMVGGAIVLWFIVVVFRAIARGARSEDPLARGLAIGGGAGIVGILTHSLFDFNLQLPSNALLFLALTAVVSVAVPARAKAVARSAGKAREFEFVTGVSS